MKSVAACLLASLSLGDASAWAQAASDQMDRLRECSTLSQAERIKCLDRLSREIGPAPARPQSSSGTERTATPETWVVSETTSPVDYSPIVIATAIARDATDGSGMKLSIACRSGTTSLVLGGPTALPPGDGYAVAYAIDGGPPTTLAAAVTPSGTGMAVSGDVIRLLVSLPVQGEIAFRIVGRQSVILEGHYSLPGLKATRERMAIRCKWPLRPDTPRQ